MIMAILSISVLLLNLQVDQFLVHKLLNSQVRQLTAVPGMVDTSKGKIRSSPIRTIYENHPGFDLRCDSLRSYFVLAEDHCPKAKRRIVCNPYRLCLVADSEHQEDRAEEFLLIRRIVGIDVSEYRWLEREAGFIQLLPTVHYCPPTLHPTIHLIPYHFPPTPP